MANMSVIEKMPNFKKIFEDKIKRFLFTMEMGENKHSDFREGDSVVVLRSIDPFDRIPIGSVGTIVHIIHRYKNEPNEHYEYWVFADKKKARYEINNIFNVDKAVEIIKM
jgi:hypothetical protein|tara:strand:+ start:631 stop:960 length:330 start_codon:yes stop_codon:yes gene_type:complete